MTEVLSAFSAGSPMTPPRTHPALDGYVDVVAGPDASWGTTFDLIHAPAGANRIRPDAPTPRRPDVAYSCTTDEPPIADVLLRDIQLDDIPRVTGTTVRPDAPVPAHHGCPGGPGRRTGPVLHDLAIERWGNYTTVFDADRNTVPAFAADGKWVGDAANPDAINDLVAGGCHVGQPSLLDSGLDVGRRMAPGRQHRVSSSWGRDRNRARSRHRLSPAGPRRSSLQCAAGEACGRTQWHQRRARMRQCFPRTRALLP
ncbi:hypothetical protein ACFY7Y_32980 [Streptomyces virginiae]|uniref:hypothetical protein n=1 Tax=Streptomyces virginiae TaxID=1961 RepID=UPI00368D06B6